MDSRSRMSGARSVIGVSVGWLGISMIADGLPALVLPYRLAGLGSTDATSLGLVTLVALGAGALVQPFAGRWSDRRGRIGVLFAGVAGSIVGLVAIAFAHSIELLVVGFLVAMLGVGVAQAGQQPLLADHVPRTTRGAASGAKNLFDVGGALLGFAVLAALLGRGELPTAAAVLALVLAIAAAVGLFLLKGTGHRSAARRQVAETSIKYGPPRDSGSRSRLVRLVAARFLFLVGVYVVGRFLFLFISAQGGQSPEAAAELAGFILVVLAALTVAASLPAGRLTDLAGRRAMMLTGGAIGSVGIAAMALAPTPPVLFAGGALLALGSAAFSAGSWAALVDETDGPEAGRLLGWANLGTAGAAAAAGAFGFVIDLGTSLAPGAGYLVGFGLAALCAAAGGVIAWRSVDTFGMPLAGQPAPMAR